jgi:hypothetical protein
LDKNLSKEKYVKMIDRLICQTLLRAPERKSFQTRLYFIPRTALIFKLTSS